MSPDSDSIASPSDDSVTAGESSLSELPTGKESTEVTLYPTRFQQRTMWSSLTALAIVLLGAIAVGAVILTSYVLGFLQPILIPVAVAAIIAYLLEPIVLWLTRKDNHLDHGRSVMVVFISFMLAAVLLAVLVLRPTISEAVGFWNDQVATGELQQRFGDFVDDKSVSLDSKFSDLPFYTKAEEWVKGDEAVNWISEKLAQFSKDIGRYLGRGFSSAASIIGYLLGLLLVPIYLFVFLRESTTIAHNWSNYLPLYDSKFKDELVDVLREINGYLIAFFRGQMLVSMIDGVLIAIALWSIGLPYALLIGVFVALLGLIPYIGNLICLIPAALIAIAHFGHKEDVKIAAGAAAPEIGSEIAVIVDGAEQVGYVAKISENGTIAEALVNTWSFLPTDVWVYPLIVIGLFFVLQQINGLVTAPKIVGDSVGLHPVTVIFSMLFWSLLLGGLLGALLAVPLTASVKVLFRRFIWEKRAKPHLTSDSDPTDSDPSAGPAIGDAGQTPVAEGT